MPRTKTVPSTKKTLPAARRRVEPMEPMEAAQRLNVIIEMIGAFNEYNGEGADDTGGYEKGIMRDALLEIRDGLLAEDAKGRS